MSLEDLGNLGEFIGAIAVVASLIYLALQIRHNTDQLDQNTEIIRANAELDNARLAAEFNARISGDAELAEIWAAAMLRREELSDSDRTRLNFMMGDLFYRLEGLFRQHKRGYLSDDSWNAWDRLMASVLTAPAVRAWWETRQHPFSDSFHAHVDGLLLPEKD